MTDTTDENKRLQEARDAFHAGNYAKTRDIATALLTSSEEDIATGAKDLLAQISPAPLGKYLFALTALLLVAVTAFAYSR